MVALALVESNTMYLHTDWSFWSRVLAREGISKQQWIAYLIEKVKATTSGTNIQQTLGKAVDTTCDQDLRLSAQKFKYANAYN